MAALRDLPGVDQLLNDQVLAPAIQLFGFISVRDQIRAVQAEFRANGGMPDEAIAASFYAETVAQRLRASHYAPVFNLTGTIIHTNLGRALLSAELWQSVEPLVTRPVNLEFDLDKGSRGNRDGVLERQLQELTGCEAATIVNNNAAALLLVLNTFALNKKVPVSRGELIEIGGSFRLPELMTRSGCELVEVGTTNRTHTKDFAAEMHQAAMLLKVHPSNYHIAGFTQEVSAGELAELAKQHQVPSCVDLGSGTLVDLTQWGLPAEPTPQSVLKDGIDVVTFSGDKLLGGVQAGIIVGRRDLLAQIKANPLKRALRADKVSLALLSETLKNYQNPEKLRDTVPLLNTLTLDQQTLQQRGAAVAAALPAHWRTEVCDSTAQIGSGALPDKTIPSIAIRLSHYNHTPNRIVTLLRNLPTPVVGRIADDTVWLDMRGADPLDQLITNLQALP